MGILLTGCHTIDTNTTDTRAIDINIVDAKEIGTKAIDTNTIGENTIDDKSKDIIDYKLCEIEYIAYGIKGNPFNIKYAQISGLDDTSIEKKVNDTLKDFLVEWINKECEWMERSQIYVKCKNAKYLSLCYTVEWKDDREDIMSTYTRIGVTIDMQTGERIYLDDLFKDIDILKEIIENYNYGNEFSPPINLEEASEIIHETSISESKYLEENYENDPYVYELIIDYIGSKSSFYLTDDKLIITRDRYELNDLYIDFKQ